MEGGNTTREHPIIVVGAGAAGLMAAIFAASNPRQPVVLLERTRDGGRKILISGGGRCNVLPSRIDPGEYVTSSSPNTLRKLLLDWPLAEQRQFFEEELEIPLRLETDTGKLFPASNRARDVRDGLVRRARDGGVELRFGSAVADLIPTPDELIPWTVVLEGGERMPARRVILASGGLSVPATGSDGEGLHILARLGHTVNPLYPALTPLLATPPVHADLAGLSLEVTLNSPGGRNSPRDRDSPGGKERNKARGGFLFTHRGYSGPVVLDLSHLATRARIQGVAREFLVQWSHEPPEAWDARLRKEPAIRVRAVLRRELPARLADRLLEEAEVDPETPIAQLRRGGRMRLATLLGAYPLPWSGDEGYRKAEVTGGGIDLSELHPRSLESRILPGLHLCGELLDAFGPIGGYNFAWAWATGRRAGLGAAGLVTESPPPAGPG